MKIISGGGGIDEDGNWYELPTVEHEVPDDYKKRLVALFKSSGSRKPSLMIASPEFLEALSQTI